MVEDFSTYKGDTKWRCRRFFLQTLLSGKEMMCQAVLLLVHSFEEIDFLNNYCNFLNNYWEYKLVRSIQKCIYFKTKWMNRSIKVMSIAAYYFFSQAIFEFHLEKMTRLFGGDPILEPIFDFCERSKPVTCCILRNNQ